MTTGKAEIERTHSAAIRQAEAEFTRSYRTHRLDRAAVAADEAKRDAAYAAANKARREALTAAGLTKYL